MAKGIKTGGRVKGTPNKDTNVLSTILNGADFCPAKRVIAIIKNGDLTPKEEADLCIKMMDFIFSKKKAIEHSGSVENVNKRYEDYINEIENGESNGDS